MAEPKSPLERLREKPGRFRFDAAYRLLLNFQAALRDDDDSVRFVATATTSQPNTEVTAAEPAKPRKPARLTTPMIGLIGPSTVMPRWYTELIAQSVRNKSTGVVDFFDLLAQRLVVAFARAGIKYRLHRSAETSGNTADAVEPIGAGLLALTGYGTAHMADRLAAGPDILRHYAGFFSSRPRSADRLAAMVSHYLGRPATIVEFAGTWLTLPPDQQSRLPRGRVPGAFNRLGQDAAIGTRAYDQQARFIVRIGPLNHDEFNALLPDQARLGALVSLIRAYVGWEADFAINLVLTRSEIPQLRMAGKAETTAPRLGWTSWLPSSTSQLKGQTTTDEAIFGATMIEAMPAGHA